MPRGVDSETNRNGENDLGKYCHRAHNLGGQDTPMLQQIDNGKHDVETTHQTHPNGISHVKGTTT